MTITIAQARIWYQSDETVHDFENINNLPNKLLSHNKLTKTLS